MTFAKLVTLIVVSTSLAACAGKKPQVEAPVVATKPAEPAKTEAAQPVAATGVMNDGRTVSFDPIYFDFDSAELRSDARSVLTSVAEAMKQSPAMKLVIEGHCDELGTSEYNLALGDRRARAAETYLKRLGVQAARLNIVSYGEERPAVQGADATAYSKNRRGEILPSGS